METTTPDTAAIEPETSADELPPPIPADTPADVEPEAERRVPMPARQVRPDPEAATAAASWVVPGEKLYWLPSGNAARLRPPQVLQMIAYGDDIPNQLLVAMEEMMETAAAQDEPDPDKRQAELDRLEASQQTDTRTRMQALLHVLREAFVEPKIAPDGMEVKVARDAGLLHWGLVGDADRMWLMNWAFTQGEAAEPFREEPEGSQGGDDGADVRDAPVEDPGAP